jgi:hypothetical protein
MTGSCVRLILVATLACSGCGVDVTRDTPPPPWLQAKIVEFEKQPPASAPSEIWLITHHGKPSYYFVQPCCDFFNPLYDADGNEICNPDGGLAGKGDGRCPEPRDQGTEAVFVWAHPRQPVHERVKPEFAGY